MLFNKAIVLLTTLAVFSLSACALYEPSQGVSTTPLENQEDLVAEIPEALFISQDVNGVCTQIQDSEAYRIGPKDSLLITVFGEKELSGEYTIDDTGTISLPFIGEVLFSGCTVRESEAVLKGLYADGYLVNPNISVEISKFRPFYIMGEVKSPGQYDFAVDTNILKAAAIAGGFTYRANKKFTKVLRHDSKGAPYYSRQPLEANVHPGDVIIVKERFF